MHKAKLCVIVNTCRIDHKFLFGWLSRYEVVTARRGGGDGRDGTGGRVCWGISRGLGRSLMNLHYAHKSNPGKADDSTPIWGAGVSGVWSAVRHRFRKLFVSQDNNSLKSMRLKGNPTAPAMR